MNNWERIRFQVLIGILLFIVAYSLIVGGLDGA